MTERTLPAITRTQGITNERLVQVAGRVVQMAIELSPDKTRKGGYLFVLFPDLPAECAQIGEIADPSKIKRYRAFAEEKPRRLASLPDHWSSFQSRNDQLERFPGAIRCSNKIIIGFSGRPSLEDEAICLVIALYMKWIVLSRAKMIADISNNQFFHQLRRAFEAPWSQR